MAKILPFFLILKPTIARFSNVIYFNITFNLFFNLPLNSRGGSKCRLEKIHQ